MQEGVTSFDLQDDESSESSVEGDNREGMGGGGRGGGEGKGKAPTMRQHISQGVRSDRPPIRGLRGSPEKTSTSDMVMELDDDSD